MANEIHIPWKDGQPNWEAVIAYGLTFAPAGWVWSTEDNGRDTNILKYSGSFLPRIGEEVRVVGFGWGTVIAYFVEYGWLGVEVRVHRPPGWWVKQRQRDVEKGAEYPPEVGHFFGIDLDGLRKPKHARKLIAAPSSGPEGTTDAQKED